VRRRRSSIRARTSDDGLAGADQKILVALDVTCVVFEASDEAVVQTPKVFLARLVPVQIGKQPPDADRQIAYQRLLELAEPTEAACGQASRDAIGQQEVDVFMTGDGPDRGAQPVHDGGSVPEGVLQLPWRSRYWEPVSRARRH